MFGIAFFNVLIAAIFVSAHFAPEPLVRIAEYIGWVYGFVLSAFFLIFGLICIFDADGRKKHARVVVENRRTMLYQRFARICYRGGYMLAILAGVSLGWATWSAWLSICFAIHIVGLYSLNSEATKIEGEIACLRGAVERAEKTFRRYGDMHLSKEPTAENTEKAKRNYEEAAAMRAALTPPQKGAA